MLFYKRFESSGSNFQKVGEDDVNMSILEGIVLVSRVGLCFLPAIIDYGTESSLLSVKVIELF